MQQNFQILGQNYYQNQLLNNLAEKKMLGSLIFMSINCRGFSENPSFKDRVT